ncbi:MULTISPECIES: PA1571 family protein [Pseudomonas]|uniref:PA1571 family protein n=1 Tax=Pseudomonas TaxID=286 RepID=UPI00155263C5|nr:PA1571 family protein [Pseudomonas tumuqii]
MSPHRQTPAPRVAPKQSQQPVGGAIIDEQGREIPITENMIQRACRELEKSLVAPGTKNS